MIMKYMMRTRRGFTIVEVLITVVIIAALAGLILPKFMNQTQQGVASEAITMMGHIRKQVLFYYDHESAWPPNLDQSSLATTLGVQFPSSANGWIYRGGGYTTSSLTKDYKIYATRVGQDLANFISLQVLTGEWQCSGTYTSLALKHIDLGTAAGPGGE